MPHTRNNLNLMGKICITSSRAVLEPFECNFRAILQYPLVHIAITSSSNDVVSSEIPSSLPNLINGELNQCSTPTDRLQTHFNIHNLALHAPRFSAFPVKNPNPTNHRQEHNTTHHHNHHNHNTSPLIPRTTRRKIEVKQTLGRPGIGGSKVVGEAGGVNRRVGRTISEIPDAGTGQIYRLKIRQAGGAGGTGRAVLQRLIARRDNISSRGLRHHSIELGSGGDVHTTLRDPGGFEAAIGSNIEIGGEVVDHALVRIPTRLRRVDRREERPSALEVGGQNEAEALDNVLTLGRGVYVEGGDIEEGFEVERTWSQVVLGGGEGKG